MRIGDKKKRMARIEDQTKRQRKERVWLAVKRHPEGITEGEIAEFVGLERRTTNNYLRELESEGKIFKDSTLWCPLDYERTRLHSFDLEPEEAFSLYLGARLLVKQQDKRNETAETALLKLAHVLTSDAGVGKEIEEAAHELAHRPVSPEYLSVFRTVVQGYMYRLRVAVHYHPYNAQPFDASFATYLIEPSASGYSTYLIGYSNHANALRSYKLERIEAATLTREKYTIPANFPGLEILHNAWSIYYGDKLVHVTLRFSPEVRQRVLESQWHPSQQVEEDNDHPGYLLWHADVADTTDLFPWVRSWGSNVEVLEPESLRQAYRVEAEKLMAIYLSSKPKGEQ
jgi:predicted DNA-binding transcriptional regulator YafY